MNLWIDYRFILTTIVSINNKKYFLTSTFSGGGFFILVNKIGHNCNLVENDPHASLNVLQCWILLGMCLRFSVKGVEVNIQHENVVIATF